LQKIEKWCQAPQCNFFSPLLCGVLEVKSRFALAVLVWEVEPKNDGNVCHGAFDDYTTLFVDIKKVEITLG
jgi:hypothetical protein